MEVNTSMHSIRRIAEYSELSAVHTIYIYMCVYINMMWEIYVLRGSEND